MIVRACPSVGAHLDVHRKSTGSPMSDTKHTIIYTQTDEAPALRSAAAERLEQLDTHGRRDALLAHAPGDLDRHAQLVDIAGAVLAFGQVTLEAQAIVRRERTLLARGPQLRSF